MTVRELLELAAQYRRPIEPADVPTYPAHLRFVASLERLETLAAAEEGPPDARDPGAPPAADGKALKCVGVALRDRAAGSGGRAVGPVHRHQGQHLRRRRADARRVVDVRRQRRSSRVS